MNNLFGSKREMTQQTPQFNEDLKTENDFQHSDQMLKEAREYDAKKK